MNSELVVPEKIFKNHRFTLHRFYLALVMGVALHLNKVGCFVLRNIELGPIGVGKIINDQTLFFTFQQSQPEERVTRKSNLIPHLAKDTVYHVRLKFGG